MTDGDLESLVAEYVELTAGVSRWPSLDELADRHGPQLKYTTDTSRLIALMCSRRAGKTVGIAQRYATRSMAKAGGNRVYIALTKDQARGIMWEPIWKPLCDRFGLPRTAHNETRQVTTFPNGSTVRFTGSDDIRHIATELGGALDEATIDESQDQPEGVLIELTEKVLPPALGDRLGTLALSGVVPEVAAGFYWETYNSKRWSNHNWSMFDNPHFPNAQQIVDEYLASHPGMTIDEPLIQRDYYGRFVFDKLATAYRYDPAINRYDAIPPTWIYEAQKMAPCGTVMVSEPWIGVNEFSVGIDPGTTDRFAIQVWGWGTNSRNVQHVFDWASPRKANVTLGQIGAMLGLIETHYGPVYWYWDPGSGKLELDTFTADYGVPLIRAALKTDLPGQVRRNNDLLAQGRIKVMRGSALEEDYQKARWDPDARARGVWRWSSQWHPDPSEAARYALQGYYDSYVEPEPELTLDQRVRAERDARKARTQDDKDAEELGMPPPEEVLDLAQMWDDE